MVNGCAKKLKGALAICIPKHSCPMGPKLRSLRGYGHARFVRQIQLQEAQWFL